MEQGRDVEWSKGVMLNGFILLKVQFRSFYCKIMLYSINCMYSIILSTLMCLNE